MPTKTATREVAAAARGEARRPLATIHEVAAYLNVPVWTIRGWRKRKAGDTGPKARKIGGQLRFDWQDVDDWLAEHEAA